jgi:hypothetical protein
LGWIFSGTFTVKAIWNHKGGLVSGTPCRALDPDDRWIRALSRLAGPIAGALPGFGSVCPATLQDFPTTSDILKSRSFLYANPLLQEG